MAEGALQECDEGNPPSFDLTRSSHCHHCISLRAKEKEDMCPMDNQDLERRHGDIMTNPDVLSKINREETLHLNSLQDLYGRARNDPVSAELPRLKTDFCLRKEEPVSVFTDHLDAEIGESGADPNSGHDIVSFCIKDEEETYCMDLQDSNRIESVSSPSGNGTMNIKQKVGYPVKHAGKTTPCKTSSGKDKVKMVRSFEKGTDSGSLLWSEINRELGGEKPTHCESGFNDTAHLNLYQGTTSVQNPEAYNDFWSNVCHANLLKCQPKLEKTSSLYSCTECEKTFSKNKYLITHMSTHTGVRLYQCTECEKSFSKNKYLLTHKSTHTGVRPYQCTECEKSFSKKDHLFVHKRTHTGERPYNCTVCQKSFSQNGVLTRHQKTHMYVKT